MHTSPAKLMQGWRRNVIVVQPKLQPTYARLCQALPFAGWMTTVSWHPAGIEHSFVQNPPASVYLDGARDGARALVPLFLFENTVQK